jgi:2'-5' RNA ligase
MQKFTQKWTIMVLLEQMDEGTEFFWKNWPQHITLVDIFSVDWKNNNLLERLEALLAEHKSFNIVAADETSFGSPKEPVPVTLFEKGTELQSLHNDTIELLKNAGAIFNNPQYVGEGFIAHSTIQNSKRLHMGDIVNVKELTIVDMFPHGDGLMRRIFRTIKFAGQ